jgi:cob(I)alamin adenosyltransferase
MKIYTRTGDTGQTQVYTHEVLKKDKDDSLLQCYGTLDELNSYVGLVAAHLVANTNTCANTDSDTHTVTSSLPHAEAIRWLEQIQRDIFAMGFAMSNASQLRDDGVQWLESCIDSMTEQLAPQTSFILPGGTVNAAHVHVARTIVRRAERELVTLHKHTELAPNVLKYINRLSDFMFVLARATNAQSDIADISV